MSSRRQTLAATIAVFLAAGFALGACGSAQSPRAATPSAHAGTAAAQPSTTTRMICAAEAGHDIATAIGVSTVRPVTPTWKASKYSCAYAYRDGSFTLSVQQLSDAASTARFFTAFAAILGGGTKLTGLGQAALATPGGMVIVRKDDKVLTVDARALPARFGNPSDTRANVALTIAATIMGCWTGS